MAVSQQRLSPSNGMFSWALAGARWLFLAPQQISRQLHFRLLEEMQGVGGGVGLLAKGGKHAQDRNLAAVGPEVQACGWARPDPACAGGLVAGGGEPGLCRLPG